MKRLILVLTVLAAALVAPLPAQGHMTADDVLRVRLELPVSFSDPTPRCPDGVVTYGISSDGQTGTGRNCVLGFVDGPCSNGAPISGGGTVVFKATTFEILKFDEILVIG